MQRYVKIAIFDLKPRFVSEMIQDMVIVTI